MARLSLTYASCRYDRIEALRSGEVRAEDQRGGGSVGCQRMQKFLRHRSSVRGMPELHLLGKRDVFEPIE